MTSNRWQPAPPVSFISGGDGLARGYFNREELTAERFIPHPFHSEADAPSVPDR